jgi:hypothetical protein|nr:hypothetical protein [Neorhizobium tomejilense]
MTLNSIVRDIDRYGRSKLDMLGLTVHAVESQFADTEDHSVEFRDAAGRVHAVSLTVSSLAPSWNSVSLSRQHFDLNDLPGTDVKCVKLGFSFPDLESATPGAKVAELLTYLRDNWSFAVIDDPENARTVTDSRFIRVLPLLMERFDNEVRFERSAPGGRVDIVKLVDDTGKASLTVQLGMGHVWITYEEDDEEKKLHYRTFPEFEDNFPNDMPVNPVGRQGGPRP